MTRPMHEIREEIQQIAKENIDFAMKIIDNIKEEILIAFLAKYGAQPDEIVCCYKDGEWWVEKRIKVIE